jgi:hypothetical protein
MYPHRIRLRGPWECEPTGQPPGRLVMPCTLDEAGLAGVSGMVRFRRRFGYPGRIDAHERVWLVLEGMPGPARLLVNDIDPGAVESPGTHEFDVTALLQPRNELVIDLDVAAGLWHEATLEVRCLAYLRGVRAAVASGVLRVTGEVVGPPVGPLELYLVADRSPEGYRTITPAPDGQRFELTAAAVTAAGAAVRVAKIELVKGASVWYTMEVDLIAQAAQGPGA